MNRKKILFTAIAIMCAVAAGVAYYEYNRKAPDVASLNAQNITAANLFNDYAANEQHANNLYLNKPLQVSGKVLEVKQTSNEPAQVILDTGDPMFGVACTMDNVNKKIEPGEYVTIKGICTGYLNDVILIKSLLLR